MPKPAPHKWEFTPRFRSGAYSWKGSRLAADRLKQAIVEIRTVAKMDSVLGGDGAIRLLSRLWPAFQYIDTSSGALGNATSNAVDTLVDLLVSAQAPMDTRRKWLDQLWEAVEQDGVGYLQQAIDRWGELCVFKEIANEWIERFIYTVRGIFSEPDDHSYFRGTSACLSCLIASGRNLEVLDLLALLHYKFWHYHKYGVAALAKMGRIDEAIAYAQEGCGLSGSSMAADKTCEELLLSCGRDKEAYERFAFSANVCTTNLATFRLIRKRYPNRNPESILRDLIVRSPGDEGRWFATAKELGQYKLALELVTSSPCDPKTLNRAARDFAEKNREFSLGAALASLRWISKGYGYEITIGDAQEACMYAVQAADALGRLDAAQRFAQELLDKDVTDSYLRKTIIRCMRLPQQ